MQSRECTGARTEGEREGALTPVGAETIPERILALQRAAGNAAVGAMLQRSRVLARAPTRESMDAAYAEFGVQVPGANVFSFIVRLSRGATLYDGGGGFTWPDFLSVIGTPEGKKWVKDKWRDQEGAVWGDQLIQGQHEWIKTDDVTYVVKTIVLNHGGAQLDAWLSALESLRIPTADVAFNPQIAPGNITQANTDPTTFTASSLGTFSGHVGAFYSPRATPHPTNPDRYAYRPETSGEKKSFHSPLHQLLQQHLNAGTNDLPGFLNALRTFQSQKLWGGDIEGLEEEKARQIPNDFRAKQTSGASLRGRYSSSFEEGEGITTTFEEASSVADLQAFAHEAKERNENIMDARINAILSMTEPTGVPQPLSNYRPSAPTEAPWTVDPTGRSVADYDRESGYDASMLEPIGTGGDDMIVDDVEPDEVYTQDDRPMSDATPGEQATFDDELLSAHGRPGSAVTRQVEQRFAVVNAEVLRLTGEAYNTTIQQFDLQVSATLAEARDDQKAAIIAAAQIERAAIHDRYNARIRIPYDKYLAAKRALDLQLFAQEPRQTTAEALQRLLLTYLGDVNGLLDTYIAEVKAILAS